MGIGPWRINPWYSGSLIGAALAISFAATAQAAIVVNIDKSAQRMTVAVDGATRYVWPVSTGRAGYDTPNGTFKVNRMDADHLSQEWDNAPMPHTMFFDMHGHAIHGFFDVKHLGSPVSHGCVRLAPANAATLFALVQGQARPRRRFRPGSGARRRGDGAASTTWLSTGAVEAVLRAVIAVGLFLAAGAVVIRRTDASFRPNRPPPRCR